MSQSPRDFLASIGEAALLTGPDLGGSFTKYSAAVLGADGDNTTSINTTIDDNTNI